MSGPVVLSVDASDPAGLLGVQADQRTVERLGGRCLTVVTAVLPGPDRTAGSVHDLPAAVVKDQLDSVQAPGSPGAARVGVLTSVPVVRAVARCLVRLGCPLVLELVAVLRAGPPLLGRASLDVVRRELVPRALVVLVGPEESSLLGNRQVRDEADAKAAARVLAGMGAGTVVVRGPAGTGPLGLLDGRTWYRLPPSAAPLTGLSLGATIALFLAGGEVAPEAVERAVRAGTSPHDLRSGGG